MQIEPQAMKTISATFETAEAALAAKRELLRSGLAASAITLLSSEPIAEAVHDEPTKSRIGGFAIGGALVGALIALGLTIQTSRQVAIVTGGMPIVTSWAFGIIVFELLMLGAILSALIRLIFEARLMRFRGLTSDDRAVAEGKVVITVACADEEGASSIQQLLDSLD